MKNIKIITLNFILTASLAITAYAKQTNIDKTNTQTSDGNAMQIGTTNNNLITNQNLEKQSISELISRYKTMWDADKQRRENIIKSLENFNKQSLDLGSFTTEQFDLLQSTLLDYYEFSILFNTKYAFFIELMEQNKNNQIFENLGGFKAFYKEYSEFIEKIQPAVQKINAICNTILTNDDYCKKIQNAYIENLNNKEDTAINYYLNNINLNKNRLNNLRTTFQELFQNNSSINHISRLWTNNFDTEQINKNNFIDKNTEISHFTIIPKYEKDNYSWRNDYELPINLKNEIFHVSPCFKINLNILAAVYKLELLKITYYWDIVSTKNLLPSEEDYQEFVEYANNLFKIYNSLRCFVMAYENDKCKYIREETFNNVSAVWLDYARIKNNDNDIINAFSSNNTDTTSCHQEYYFNILRIKSIQDFYNHISNNSAYYDNLKNISNLEDLDNFYLQMSQNSSTLLNISNNLNNNNIEDTKINTTKKKESGLFENNMSYEDLLPSALDFENENNLGPYDLIGKYATSYNDSKNIPPLTNLNNFYSQISKEDQNNLNNNNNNEDKKINTNTNQKTPNFFNDDEKQSALELLKFYKNMWDSDKEKNQRANIIESLGKFNKQNLYLNTLTATDFQSLQSILLNYYNFSVLFNAKYAFFFEWMEKNKNNQIISNLPIFQSLYGKYSDFMTTINQTVNRINSICNTILSENDYCKMMQISYTHTLKNGPDVFSNKTSLSNLKTNLQNIFDFQNIFKNSGLQDFSKLWIHKFSQNDIENNNFINETNNEIDVVPPVFAGDHYPITQDLKEALFKIFPCFKTNLHVLAAAYRMELLKTTYFMDVLSKKPENYKIYSVVKKYTNDIFTIYNTLGCLISFFNEEPENKIKNQNISLTYFVNIDERWPIYINKINKNNDIINSFFSEDKKKPSYHEQYYDINYDVKSISSFYNHIINNIQFYNNLKNISNVEDLNAFVTELNSSNSNNLDIPNTLDNNQNTSFPVDNTFLYNIENTKMDMSKKQNIPSISDEDDMELDTTKKPKVIPVKTKVIPVKTKEEQYQELISYYYKLWDLPTETKQRNDIKNLLEKFVKIFPDKAFYTKNNPYIPKMTSSNFDLLQYILLKYYNFVVLFNTKYSLFIALMIKNKDENIVKNSKEYQEFNQKYSQFIFEIKKNVKVLNRFCHHIFDSDEISKKIQNIYSKNIDNNNIQLNKNLNKKISKKLLSFKSDLQDIFKNTRTDITLDSQLWGNVFKEKQITNNDFIDENTPIDKFEVLPNFEKNYEISPNLKNKISPQYKINSYILAAAYKMELLKSQYYMKKLKDESLKDKDQKDIKNNKNKEDIFKSYEATKTYANDVFKTYNSLICLMMLDKNLKSKDSINNKNNENKNLASDVFIRDVEKFNTFLGTYASNRQVYIDDIIKYIILIASYYETHTSREKIIKDFTDQQKINSISKLYFHILKNNEAYNDLINISNMKDLKNFYSKIDSNMNNLDNLKSENIKFPNIIPEDDKNIVNSMSTIKNSKIITQHAYKNLKDYIPDKLNLNLNSSDSDLQLKNKISKKLLAYYNDIWNSPEDQQQRNYIVKRLNEFDQIYKNFDSKEKIEKNIDLLNEDFNSIQSILLDYYDFLLFFSKYNHIIKILTLNTQQIENLPYFSKVQKYQEIFIDNYEKFTNSIKEKVANLKKFVIDLLIGNFKDPENINYNILQKDVLNRLYETSKRIIKIHPNFEKIFSIMGLNKFITSQKLNQNTSFKTIDNRPSFKKYRLNLYSINKFPPHYLVNLDILATVFKMEILRWLPYFKQMKEPKQEYKEMENITNLEKKKNSFVLNFAENKAKMDYYINKIYNSYDKLKNCILWAANGDLINNIQNDKIFSDKKIRDNIAPIYISKILGRKKIFKRKMRRYIRDNNQFYTTLYLPNHVNSNVNYTTLFQEYFSKRHGIKSDSFPLVLLAQHIKNHQNAYNQLMGNGEHNISNMQLWDNLFYDLDPEYFSEFYNEKNDDTNTSNLNNMQSSDSDSDSDSDNSNNDNKPTLEKNKNISKNIKNDNTKNSNIIQIPLSDDDLDNSNDDNKPTLEENKNISKNIKNDNTKNSNIILIPLSYDDLTQKQVTKKRTRPTSNKKTKTKTKTKLPNNKTIPSLRRSERIKARNSRLKKSFNSTISMNVDSLENNNIPLEEHNNENTKNSIISILKTPIINKINETRSNNILTNNNLTNNNLTNNNLTNNNLTNNNLTNNNLPLEEFNNTDNLNQTSLQVQFEPNNSYNNKSEILTLNNQNNQNFLIPIITNTPLPTTISKNKTSTNNLPDNNQINKKIEENKKDRNQSNKKTKEDKKNQNQNQRRSIRILEQNQKRNQEQLQKQIQKKDNQVTSNKNKTTQTKSKPKKTKRNTAKNKTKTNKNDDKLLSKKRANSANNNENNTINLSSDNNISLEKSKQISILKNPNVRQIKPTTNSNNNNNNLTSNANTNSNPNNSNTSNMALENANIDNLNQIAQNNQNSSNQEPSNNQNNNNSVMEEEKNEQQEKQNKEQQDDNK